MPGTAAEIARRLARQTHAVCRAYLPAGRRQGRYWLVGDVDNTPGRSLYVRLVGPETGKSAMGKWTDAHTGQHGDLLDLIAASRHLTMSDALAEARRFLHDAPPPSPVATISAPSNSPLAARRLFAAAKPLAGTLGARYLRSRGIIELPSASAVRFHPRCYCRPDADDAVVRPTWPALIAAVTDTAGTITAVQRTWLDPSRNGKAPVSSPRRSLGDVNGQGVRIGPAGDVLAVGEGLETMLSLRQILPALPIIASGSATHLASLVLPADVRRLYVAIDRDGAGYRSAASLVLRATTAAIEVLRLTPTLGDFNDDLRALGSEALWQALRPQLRPDDIARFGSGVPCAEQALAPG